MDRNAFLEALPFLFPRSASRSILQPASVRAPLRSSYPHPAGSGGEATTRPSSHSQYQLEQEIIISRQHYLSIEPLRTWCDDDPLLYVDEVDGERSPCRRESLGVAFFEVEAPSVPQRKASDPALTPCEIELCVARRTSSISPERETKVSPPRKSTRPSPPSARPFPPGQPTSTSCCARTTSHEASSLIASFSMKINERVYFVNWTRLNKIRVAGPNFRRQQPACLLLYFPGCLFRIFELAGDDSAILDESPDSSSASTPIARYQALKKELDQLLSLFHSHSPLAEAVDVTAALSESSWDANPPRPTVSAKNTIITSSSARNAVTGGASPPPHGRGLTASGKDAAAAVLRRQQNAYGLSVGEFASLWKYLMLDSSAAARQPSHYRDGTRVGSLLTTVAQDLAASFGGVRSAYDSSLESTWDVRESYRSEIQHRLERTRRELDALLDLYFPAPRHRNPAHHPPAAKRRRQQEPVSTATATTERATVTPKKVNRPTNQDAYGGGGGRPTEAAPTGTLGLASPANVEEAMRTLIARHKELIREQHAMEGLPSRY